MKKSKVLFIDRYQPNDFDFFSSSRISGGYLYHVNGSFTTRGMNERKDGVRYFNIA